MVPAQIQIYMHSVGLWLCFMHRKTIFVLISVDKRELKKTEPNKKQRKHGHQPLYAFAFSKSQLALSELRPVLQTTTTPATVSLVPSSSISLPTTPRSCIHSTFMFFFNSSSKTFFLLFTPFQIKERKWDIRVGSGT